MTIAPYFYDPDTDMADAALKAVRARTHLIIVAPPGTGKVYRVANALIEYGHRFWEIRASQLDHGDFRTTSLIPGDGSAIPQSPVQGMLHGDKVVLITDWWNASDAFVGAIIDAIDSGCAPLLLFFHHKEKVPLRFARIPFWEAKVPTAP